MRSTVPGGYLNAARGEASFAAGSRARADHEGSFVWQDNTGIDQDSLSSTADRQFLARASGGFKFLTAPALDFDTGAELAAGSGAWATLSSEASKTGFTEIDPRNYLERVSKLEVLEWQYKAEEGGITHVGPMAEAFYAAFGHGANNRTITTVDADGVALAAIQGLYELVQQQQAEIEQMRAALERAGLK